MNWLVELAIILFAFNAVLGIQVAIAAGVLYVLWSGIKVITAYRAAKKIVEELCKGCRNETNKKRK